MNSKRRLLRPASLALFVLLLTGIHVHVDAQGEPLTLAWDASPAAVVGGYIVYVGNASGSYVEQYDVGNQTSFVYARVNDGRPYFFAVAAYAPGREIGPLSEEIFFLAVTVTSGAPATLRVAPSGPSTAPSSASLPALCTPANEGNCYRVDRVATVLDEIRALTPTGDGRLFFVDGAGRHVRVIAGDTLLPDAALAADSESRLTDIALDPAFDRNHFVYVGQIDTRADGRREFSIIRYREMASLLAEGAAVVSAIPISSMGDAPFTIDGSRRLYIAVPVGSPAESPYAGMVLRFESDGSVPRDSRGGSPIFAHGYADPASLVWSSAGNQLWLAGSEAVWQGPLAWLPLTGDSAEWPRTPAGVPHHGAAFIVSLFSAEQSMNGSIVRVDGGGVILVDEEGALHSIDAQTRRVAASALLPATADLGGDPVSAVLDNNSLYVVVRPTATSLDTASQILRVRRN